MRRMKRLKFRVTNLQEGLVKIEKIDKNFLRKQASIALQAYEKKKLPHQGPLKNVLGLAAEGAFKQWLEEFDLREGEDFEWNERKADFWKEGKDRRPWDFKFKNGTTFEIGAARPFHTYAVLMSKQHKKESKYFVQVQIKRFKATTSVFHEGKERWYHFDANSKRATEISDPEKIKSLESLESNDIGEAVICGYDAVKTILAEENGWKFSPKGSRITPHEDGMIKPLSELESLENLKKLIPKRETKEKKKMDLDRYLSTD